MRLTGFRWQRCVSTNCRPVGLLPCGAAACLQLRGSAQRDHVAGCPGDISDVSAYYAGATAPFLPLADTANAALVAQGERLAKIGNEAKGVPGCVKCHGADGAGQSPTIPYLAGQYGHYISFELKMWQRGFRNTSPKAMAVFAKQLDDQDVAALAAYYQPSGYQPLRGPPPRAGRNRRWR